MFRNTHGLKVPFVFSKFNNLLNDIMAKMENDGQSLGDLPVEEQIPTLLVEAERVLNEFKFQIEKVFKDVVYFIYDPTCEGYFADTSMKLYFETAPDGAYPIDQAHTFIRKDLNFKFLEQVQKTQVQRQIMQLFKNCNTMYNKIKNEVISRRNIEDIIDREMAYIEKTNEKQAKIQAQTLDDVFSDFKKILTDSFEEFIKGKKGVQALDANEFQE